MAGRSDNFVSTQWLADHLDDPDVVIVDASWHLPNTPNDAALEYAERHIPGAVFFDIDAISDQSDPLPHMLPSAAQFGEAVGALGIGRKQTIIVYDSVGLSSAPRVWWTFRVMGAEDVRILDGGLPKWLAEGRPVTDRRSEPPRRVFDAGFDAGRVRDLAQIRANIEEKDFQLVDARAGLRFIGEAPEPRPWVKSGHVPGSFNLPSNDLVAEGRLKDEAALREAFETAGVDLGKPIVTSCGSGVSAAILTLALDTIGVPVAKTAIYDGSWTEWGSRIDTEIATGTKK